MTTGEPGGGGPVRVVVVDDHPLFRAGLRVALESAPDMRVVAEAGDADGAFAAVAATRPDAVIMDLYLPDRSGLDVTERLTREHGQSGVLVMTMSDDGDLILAALRAGARGYLLKSAGLAEVLHAVRTVAHGGSTFSAGVATHLTALLTRSVPRPAALATLSRREQDVLDLVARGYDNRRIARELYLSEKTVRNYVSNLLSKLEVPNRAAAVACARDAGLGQRPVTQP